MRRISASRPPPMYMRSLRFRCPGYNGRDRDAVTAPATIALRGDVAEWLGRGLQSLVQRFESARRLHLIVRSVEGRSLATKRD